MLLKEHKQIHKQLELMCYMCNYAHKKKELLHKYNTGLHKLGGPHQTSNHLPKPHI